MTSTDTAGLDPLVDALRDGLRDGFVTAVVRPPDIYVRVEPSAWRAAASFLRESLGFSYFCFLSGLDWLPNPDLDGEKVFDSSREPSPPSEIVIDEGIRITGGSSRFQVFARVQNIDSGAGLFLFADLDESLTVDSLVSVYRGADWHEREAWEMFGFTFAGHPEMRHIYLPEDFEGHPLRKDFHLLAREVRPWPGLVDMEEMPVVPSPESSESGGDAE